MSHATSCSMPKRHGASFIVAVFILRLKLFKIERVKRLPSQRRLKRLPPHQGLPAVLNLSQGGKRHSQKQEQGESTPRGAKREKCFMVQSIWLVISFSCTSM